MSPSRKAPRSAEEIEALATALLTNTNNLSDPAQVNQFLANLLNQLAHNKISRRNAIAMAYISQLLLNSISVKHKQDRDAQAAQRAADASKPMHLIVDLPRPNYGSGSDFRSGESSDSHSVDVCSGAPLGRHASDFRSGESLDLHSVDVPIADPVPNRAPNNPPPPTDDPPSTHPKHVPLPRWGGLDPVTNYTYREPVRPNTYGPPRMRATRRRPGGIARFRSTGIPACARLMHRRDSAMDRRRPTMSRDLPWVYLPSRRTGRGTITVSPRSSQFYEAASTPDFRSRLRRIGFLRSFVLAFACRDSKSRPVRLPLDQNHSDSRR